MRCLVLGPTWWQRAAFSDLALFTNRVDVQVEVLVPQKCHLASLEMGQKSFLNYLHCQSRLLKIPKEFLNSQAARFLPVPSTFALRAEPCFFHTLLLPKAWTMPSSLHSCISVLLQTHKVGLGHVQTCPCFQVGGPFPSSTVLTGQQQCQSQNHSSSSLLFTHNAFNLCLPFPLLSGVTLTGKSRISMPVPEFACRALRTPQQPSLCMGFLVICSQKRNSRRLCDMVFLYDPWQYQWSPVGKIPAGFTSSARNSGPRVLKQPSQCHLPCQDGHYCCRNRMLSMLQDRLQFTQWQAHRNLFTEESASTSPLS